MFINDVTWAGFMGRDAELFVTQGGLEVVTLAIGHNYKTKDGKETTTWLKCKVFSPWAADAKNFKKGENVYVTGRLQENRWKDKEGNDRTSIELIANQCGVIKRLEARGPGVSVGQQPVQQQATAAKKQPDFSFDDVPF